MADNIAITAGSGTTVATDDVSSAHYQKVKLADGTDGSSTMVGDGSGRIPVVGAAADGAAVAGNPVLVAGQDGTNAQSLLTDSSGRMAVIGAAADGAAVAGNPILIAGQDGTNAQSIKTDSSGELQVDVLTMPNTTVVGAAADGAAVSGNPVLIAGQDGTNTQSIKTDTNGELQVDVLTLPNATVVGAAADGAAVSGNPVLIAGQDGTNAQSISTNASGHINIADGGNVITVDGSGTFTTSDTATQVDDAAFTPATGRVLMIGAELDNTLPDSVDEGDGGALRMSANRNLFVNIRDNAGNERGLNIDASGNANVIAAANSGVDIGDVTINNASGASAVNIQDGGNSITIDGTVTASNTAGDVAHDGADSGNPVKVGAKAVNAEPTAVANGDRANLITDLVGKLITLPYANPENFLNGSGNATGTADTAVIAAQGAGVKIYVTSVTVANTSATNTYVNLKDGATTKLVVSAPANGGATWSFPVPLVISANTAFNFASGASVTTMYVSALGYKGA